MKKEKFIRWHLRVKGLSSLRQRLSQLLLASLSLFLSTLMGIGGYMYFEDISLADAFYMTIITISTVGMNEVQSLNPSTRLFASFYIIFNLIVFAYFVAMLTKYFFEGELKEIFKNYLSTQQIQHMEKHIIVCGFGRYGRRVCEELLNNDVPITVIEKTKGKIANFHLSDKISYVEGDATLDHTLWEAGIGRARALITALHDDAANVFVVLTARELNPPLRVVAKANSEHAVNRLKRAGANSVVMPDLVGGLQMANLVIRPEVVEFLNMINGVSDHKLKLHELRFDQIRDHFRNKPIAELNLHDKTGVLVVGFKDKEKGFVLHPPGDTVPSEGDTLIVLGSEQEIEQFVKHYVND